MMSAELAIQNKMKFGTILLFGINCLLGAGIFITPGKAYSLLGVNLFWVLAVCAVMAIIMALAFAEMAGIFTKTGGVYIYASAAWGPFIGFNIGFMRFLAACVALSVQVAALPSIVITAFHIHLSMVESMAISIVFACLLYGINLISVRVVSVFTRLSSWLVLATLAGCIIISYTHFQLANLSSVTGLVSGSTGTPVPGMGQLSAGQFSAGFLLLFYAMVGFENIGVAAQDMENPTRDVPRAIIVVLITVSLIYFLLFSSVLGAMGGAGLSLSDNSVADSVGMVLGTGGRLVISLGSLVALFGIGLAMCFAGPRNLVPLAVDKFLPESAGANNARGVPAQSIVIMLCVTIFFIVLANEMSSQAFVLLVQVATVCRLLQYLIVTVGIFSIRKQKLAGTYKMPAIYVLIPLCVLACIYLGLKVSPVVLLITLGLIVISLVIYLTYSSPRARRMQTQTSENVSN
ncbi:APC family permease [Salmonella enterica]|nr:APC family permease [Salmonella enterica]